MKRIMKSSTGKSLANVNAIYHIAHAEPKNEAGRLPLRMSGAMLAVRDKDSEDCAENHFWAMTHLIDIAGPGLRKAKNMTGTTHKRATTIASLLMLAAAPGWSLYARQPQSPPPAQQGTPQQTDPATKQEKGEQNATNLPRGKKLFLKDGSVQVVREYARTGETVRYYSLQESQWEEIPATLVDWDATTKAEAEQEAKEKEFAARIATQEKNREAVPQLDIDASLQVAPGVILPQDEGMFALAGTKVVQLTETRTEIKTDKGRYVEKVLSPIPIVPGRQRVVIKGKHSPIRLTGGEMQFYYRINVDDADPTIELLRAVPDGEMRRVEWIVNPAGYDKEEQRESISVLKWQVAKGVFRFTVSQPIEPGEYALAVVLQDGLNVFVWDFGVDKPQQTPTKNK
jgi:hypothetical protein